PQALPPEPPKPPPRIVAPAQRQAPAPRAAITERPAAAPSTAAPASTPQVGPAGAAIAPSVESLLAPDWNARLAGWLQANRRYPHDARRRGEEGVVHVRFTAAANGLVTDVTLVDSSGSPSLDTAAVTMLRGATLPAPGAEVTRTVRIRYRLTE
ncbi:MAG: energy transducer TonB, partial [Alphaproteobacteria bacterium]|nr:energy transducer TonB [Alphaproteobacteria bacterium]